MKFLSANVLDLGKARMFLSAKRLIERLTNNIKYRRITPEQSAKADMSRNFLQMHLAAPHLVTENVTVIEKVTVIENVTVIYCK